MSSVVFIVGECECGADDVADAPGADGDVAEGLPAGGEQGHGAFTEARRALSRLLWVRLSAARRWLPGRFLIEVCMPAPAPV